MHRATYFSCSIPIFCIPGLVASVYFLFGETVCLSPQLFAYSHRGYLFVLIRNNQNQQCYIKSEKIGRCNEHGKKTETNNGSLITAYRSELCILLFFQYARLNDLQVEVYRDDPVPSLEDTMRMFNRAIMVIAPHGAGLSNLVFRYVQLDEFSKLIQ